jgi:hypothetical protein
MTPDDELLERARRAREASRTARQRAGEIVTPTAEDYAEGYVIDGECFALGQNNVISLQDCGQFNCVKRRRS